MLTGLLQDVLLRQIPQQLLAGVQSGDLKVYGSVIRSVSTGKIAGHLQETSALTKLASQALSGSKSLPIPGVGLGVDLLGHTVSYVQNEQIKAAISTVQSLQMANLALGAVGIGVSLAGFAVLSAKIGRMEAKVEALGDGLERIATGIETLRRDRIAEDFTRLHTLADQMEEGWSLQDPHSQWRHVATEAHSVANQFERRAQEILLSSSADPETAEPFLEAYAMAAATRVSARLSLGDDAAARAAAEEGAKKLARLGDHLHHGNAALSRLRMLGVQPASPSWAESLDQCADQLRPIVTAARERETAAAATALTIGELARQGIKGRDWVERARLEEEAPLLCMLTAIN